VKLSEPVLVVDCQTTGATPAQAARAQRQVQVPIQNLLMALMGGGGDHFLFAPPPSYKIFAAYVFGAWKPELDDKGSAKYCDRLLYVFCFVYLVATLLVLAMVLFFVCCAVGACCCVLGVQA